MPAETHQLGQAVGVDDVLTLLCSLLDVPDDRDEATLAELGVDQVALDDLWGAVCEEYAERTLGAELEPDVIDGTMTLKGAAATMATLLRTVGGGDA